MYQSVHVLTGCHYSQAINIVIKIDVAMSHVLKRCIAILSHVSDGDQNNGLLNTMFLKLGVKLNRLFLV